MSRVVIDAAVAVKWVVSEAGSGKAADLRRYDLVAPDIIVLDWAEILTAKASRGEISASEAGQRLKALMGAPMTLAPLQPLIARALDIAAEIGIGVRVATYLALAVTEKCQLMTADRELVDRVSGGSWPTFITPLGGTLRTPASAQTSS